jgi:hypothetical protein
MKTLGTHWKPIENLVRTHIGNMVGMMVGHPHLQPNVGMCVHSYYLCVWNKQWKFLGRIQLRNASKLTFENSLQSVHSNWVYESKANNYFFSRFEKIGRRHTTTNRFLKFVMIWIRSVKEKALHSSPPWYHGGALELNFGIFKILALSTGFNVL